MKTNHILLIDDNDIDNYINNHIIEDSKIADKITVMNSPIKALSFLDEIKDDFEAFPDLIFLDISMPRMDGFGFLEEFVKFPKAIEKQCFVIMLTSSNYLKDRTRAFEYEVVKDYFVKPLEDEMLENLKNNF